MWVWIGVNVLSPSQTLTFAFLNWGYIIAGVRLVSYQGWKNDRDWYEYGQIKPLSNRCSQAYVLTDNSAACRPRGKSRRAVLKTSLRDHRSQVTHVEDITWILRPASLGQHCSKHVLGAIQYFPFMLIKVHGWYTSVVQISSTDYLEEPNIKGTVRWLEPCPFARWRVI